nr:g-type lectin s-receptor-like serine/threonine-protein kinase [Quercus suber]
MASKSRKLTLGFVCLLLFLGPSSQLDRLLQGQELKDGDELVSAQGIFTLGFFYLTRNNYYLGIWLNDNSTRLQNLVWVANRDAPIFNNSGSLTIDDYGNLKISYNGSLSIVLCSGQEANNASAVLLDTGNFVLRETSSERQLWQSFDYPTHALVPGMRLGVNRKTGHTWSLTSWRGVLVPAVGSFTLGLEPNLKNRLVILWRESLYWTSSNVLFNLTSSGLTYYGYHFSYISNENETYLNYTGVEENYITRVIRPLKIDYFGRLSDENYTLVDCTSHDDTQGCKAQCRSHDDTFTPVSSSLKDGFKFDESDNLTHKDCEAKCFDNCSCVAYASTNQYAQTGCEIWSTLDRLIGFSNPNARTIYFLASALGERKKKQKMLIKELGGNVKASTVNGEENQQNNDEKIFSFESICAATSNFSIENKLGEGGFGPVYKAWQLWNEDKGMELIDSTILDESCPASEVLKCIHVGLLCVQEHATNRPTMLDVVSFLVNENLQLSPPKKPAFYINTVVKESEVSEIKPENCSINNVTISEMEAR